MQSYLIHDPMHIFIKLPRPVHRAVEEVYPILPPLQVINQLVRLGLIIFPLIGTRHQLVLRHILQKAMIPEVNY